jgi:hypothetical protein
MYIKISLKSTDGLRLGNYHDIYKGMIDETTLMVSLQLNVVSSIEDTELTENYILG